MNFITVSLALCSVMFGIAGKAYSDDRPMSQIGLQLRDGRELKMVIQKETMDLAFQDGIWLKALQIVEVNDGREQLINSIALHTISKGILSSIYSTSVANFVAKEMSNGFIAIAIDPTYYHSYPQTRVIILSSDLKRVVARSDSLKISPSEMIVQKDPVTGEDFLRLVGALEYDGSDVDRREGCSVYSLGISGSKVAVKGHWQKTFWFAPGICDSMTEGEMGNVEVSFGDKTYTIDINGRLVKSR